MRDEIEAALAESFDEEHLSVYADHLQTRGDPRGDLIALDLQGVADGRDELLARWLGEDVVALIGPRSIEVGFVTDLYLDDESPPGMLDAVLASPAGAYVRGATILGSPDMVAAAISRLVVGRHAWLASLAVQVPDAPSSVPLVPDDVPLATAMPALRELEVWGQRVFGDLSHPGVRSLRVTGDQAIGSLLDRGPVGLPNLAVLDLACDSTREAPAIASRLTRRVPALRRLDLSRNEPGDLGPHYLGGNVDACALLAALPARAQLSHVRLPSVRTRDQAARLTTALSEMPALRHVSAARAYHEHRHVALPHQLVLPEVFPWWPADTVGDEATLRFEGGATVDVPLVPLSVWLETTVDALPPATRDAWLHVFRLVTQGPRMRLGRDRLLAVLAVELPFDDLTSVRAALGDADAIFVSVVGGPS